MRPVTRATLELGREIHERVFSIAIDPDHIDQHKSVDYSPEVRLILALISDAYDLARRGHEPEREWFLSTLPDHPRSLTSMRLLEGLGIDHRAACDALQRQWSGTQPTPYLALRNGGRGSVRFAHSMTVLYRPIVTKPPTWGDVVKRSYDVRWYGARKAA
jgi:hypothetical protein